MPMIAGSVTISSAGTALGVGLSKELYDALSANYTFDSNPSNTSGQQALADLCNTIGQVVSLHIQVNAVVTVPPGVPVATAGTAAAQVGATTAPAIGVIT